MSDTEHKHRIPERVRNMDHSDLTSTGFWIGHVLMIIATIAGVYLAAQAGLEQAIEFDDIVGDEANYHLQHSLYDEVSDNVVLLKTYKEQYLDTKVPKQTLILNRPEMSFYIWETMKYSPATLETPAKYLSPIRRFYSRTQVIIERAEERTYGASYAAELLGKEIDEMENTVLPGLKNNYLQIAEDLKPYKDLSDNP